MLKGYTFKILLLDTNDEVRLSRIFCAETARKAADMVAEFLASIGVDDQYQLECEQEEIYSPCESWKIKTKRLRASGYRESVFKPTQSGRSKRSSAKELSYD